MKLLVVIPAHNEAKLIGQVISDLKRTGFKNILVVDDGSTDKTSEISLKSGAKVARHIINRGLGAGIGTGIQIAKEENFDIIVTFDGDGQHKAKDIRNLITPILDKKADVVIGSRMKNPRGMPVKRVALNYASNLVTFFLYGVWTTDTLSGLRGLNRKAIEKINIKTDRMEVSNEIFMEIKRNKLRLAEIPIKPIYTAYSKMHSHNSDPLPIVKNMVLRLFR